MARTLCHGAPVGEWTSPRCWNTLIAVDDELLLPAYLLAFRAPRSYTGQDVVEMHTIGCRPALRALCEKLMRLGARRALPGEFTARAFLAGQLRAGQVEAVLSLIRAQSDADARAAARMARGLQSREIERCCDELTDLLALIEAGIDFVDEEDVSFVSPQQVQARLAEAILALSACGTGGGLQLHCTRPHVALAGLPNAGKSTLFNALVGEERAIVSPVVGTTRDVISADTNLDGVEVTLQDCAGRGNSAGELEAASHLAAEHAADTADLVLWVHDAAQDWQELETQVCQATPIQQRVLVLSKIDTAAAADKSRSTAVPFAEQVQVSCRDGRGLQKLRGIISQRFRENRVGVPVLLPWEDLHETLASLRRARELARTESRSLPNAELVSLELRSALEYLDPERLNLSPDAVLGRIFNQFCVGK